MFGRCNYSTCVLFYRPFRLPPTATLHFLGRASQSIPFAYKEIINSEENYSFIILPLRTDACMSNIVTLLLFFSSRQMCFFIFFIACMMQNNAYYHFNDLLFYYTLLILLNVCISVDLLINHCMWLYYFVFSLFVFS